MSIRVLPVSRAFSTSSFTTLAGHSMTPPAAIFPVNLVGHTLRKGANRRHKEIVNVFKNCLLPLQSQATLQFSCFQILL